MDHGWVMGQLLGSWTSSNLMQFVCVHNCRLLIQCGTPIGIDFCHVVRVFPWCGLNMPLSQSHLQGQVWPTANDEEIMESHWNSLHVLPHTDLIICLLPWRDQETKSGFMFWICVGDVEWLMAGCMSFTDDFVCPAGKTERFSKHPEVSGM